MEMNEWLGARWAERHECEHATPAFLIVHFTQTLFPNFHRTAGNVPGYVVYLFILTRVGTDIKVLITRRKVECRRRVNGSLLEACLYHNKTVLRVRAPFSNVRDE